MNDERLHGDSDKGNMGNGKQVDTKPILIVSPSMIFTLLHKAAQEKAAAVLNLGNPDDINKIIINTGMSSDGREIGDGTQPGFLQRGKKFEVGIIFQITHFPDLKKVMFKDEPKDEHEKQQRYQLKIQVHDQFRKLATDGIKEYFKWFGNIQGNDIKDDEIEEFDPPPSGDFPEIKNFSLLGFSSKKKIKDEKKDSKKFKTHRDDEVEDVHGDIDKGGFYEPRLGFKYTYRLTYK